jgi:eukaryotic-like serine/threonine-protein kinase
LNPRGVGKTISHYRVLSELGKGGMGIVYEAEDLRLGRRVALKFLPSNTAGDEKTLQRFEREARAASSLNHPGICTIYEVEEHGNHPVIVMELLKGQSLKEKIHAGQISTKEMLDSALRSLTRWKRPMPKESFTAISNRQTSLSWDRDE